MIRGRYAVIVAGGQGTRMRSSVPKQFALLAGRPVLMHTLSAFCQCSFPIDVTLVLPKAEILRWKELCREYSFNTAKEVKVVAGGATRTASVRNGLQRLGREEGLVAIHDGVRPLITTELIERSYQQAERHGSAIASVLLKDSIRQVDKTGSKSCHREQYRLIQTPQTFRMSLIQAAYSQVGTQSFSDDASLVEHIGHSITLIEGEYRNLKITTPEDLVVANALLG